MNLADLANHTTNFLSDNTWQSATFYRLESGSTYWNTASLTLLPKSSAGTPEEALLVLLRKEAQALGIWQRAWQDDSPDTHRFIQWLIAERRFTNTEGTQVSPEDFWKAYSSTIEAITSDPEFVFLVDDTPHAYAPLIEVKDIVSVIRFDDTWQEQNFFVETKQSWVLYHWSTAA